MTTHIIVYRGLVGCSLGVMQEPYIPELLQFINDLEVTAGVMARAPVDVYEEEDWLRKLHTNKKSNQIFAVLAHEPGENEFRYIGHTGIHQILWPSGFGATGSLLGGNNARGNGYGTEAKLLLQYHAFRVLGLRKLTSTVKAFNAQSLGHLIKTGYRIVGRYTKHQFHDGEYVDEILLECFREDWEPLWAEYQAGRKLPKLTSGQRELVQSQITIKK